MKQLLFLMLLFSFGLRAFGQDVILENQRKRADKILMKGDLEKLRSYMQKHVKRADRNASYRDYVWRYLLDNVMINTASGELSWEFAEMAIEMNGKLYNQDFLNYHLCKLIRLSENINRPKYLAEMLGAFLDTYSYTIRDCYIKDGYSHISNYNCHRFAFDDFVMNEVVKKGKVDVLRKLDDQGYNILDKKKIPSELYTQFPEMRESLAYITAKKIGTEEYKIEKFLTDFPEGDKFIAQQLQAFAKEAYDKVKDENNYFKIREVRDVGIFNKRIHQKASNYFADFNKKEKEIYENDVKKLEAIKQKYKDYLQKAPAISLGNAEQFDTDLQNISGIKNYSYILRIRLNVIQMKNGPYGGYISDLDTNMYPPDKYFIEYFIANYLDNPIDREKKVKIAEDLYQLRLMIRSLLKTHFYYTLRTKRRTFSEYSTINRSEEESDAGLLQNALEYQKMPNYVLTDNSFRESLKSLLYEVEKNRESAVASFNSKYSDQGLINQQKDSKCQGCKLSDYYRQELYRLKVGNYTFIALENHNNYKILYTDNGWYIDHTVGHSFKSLDLLLSYLLKKCEEEYCR
jgi:hypothetical protein